MATASYQGLSTLDNLFKIYYAPRIVAQYYKSSPLIKRIRKRSMLEEYGGKQANIAVKLGWSEAVGSRAENAALPDAYYPEMLNMTVSAKRLYGRVRLDRMSIVAASKNSGAFASLMESSMEDVTENIAWDAARQRIFGYGTGTLCLANGAGSGTATLVVDTPGSTHLRKGMVIDIYTAETAGSQEVNSIRISAISSNTITLESTQTWSDNSFVFREDCRNVESMGLAGIIDDGTLLTTFQGLSRTTYPQLKANVLANGGTNRALTRDLLYTAMLRSNESGTGGWPTAIYSNFALWRAYMGLLDDSQRFVDTNMDGGFASVRYTTPAGKLEWFADRLARSNTIYFPNESDLCEFELGRPGFISNTNPQSGGASGGSVFHWVSGYDAAELVWAQYGTMAARRCGGCTALKDITEP